MKTLKKSEIINKLHVLIYLYLTFGWIISLTSCKVILLLAPTAMVQWGVNNNECIITQLENKLKKTEITMLKKDDDKIIVKEEDKGTDDTGTDVSFIGSLAGKCGIEISEYGVNFISYLSLYHSFLQSYWRVIF